MIVLAARRQDVRVIESAARIVPTVVAARALADVAVPVVTNDHRLAGAMMARHFAELGHQRVTELRGPNDVLDFPARSEGFRGEAAARGLEVIDIGDEAVVPSFEEGRRLMSEILTLETRPTAVFAHNDLMAIGAISVLHDAGLDVPGDMSVGGHNDTPLTGYTWPPLTTIRYPSWEVGHEAAEAALRLSAGESDVPSVRLEPTFVERESTGPPPS
jgi:LacI family transcriptional regulator